MERNVVAIDKQTRQSLLSLWIDLRSARWPDLIPAEKNTIPVTKENALKFGKLFKAKSEVYGRETLEAAMRAYFASEDTHAVKGRHSAAWFIATFDQWIPVKSTSMRRWHAWWDECCEVHGVTPEGYAGCPCGYAHRNRMGLEAL